MKKRMKKWGAILLASIMMLSTVDDLAITVSAAGNSGSSSTDVQTVTASESGINLTLFDFNDTDKAASINETAKNEGLDGYIKWVGSLDETHTTGQYKTDKYGEGFIHGMVSNKLVNGYPAILKDYHDQDNQVASLGFLFGGKSSDTVTQYNTNNGLFWKTADGYYEYYSDMHAADYDVASNRFYVRDYRETTETTAGRGLKPTDIGYYDFLPFNYTEGVVAGNAAKADGTAGNEYHVKLDDVNYWFGMKIDTAFEQPKDGKLEDEAEMVFEFTGDDDVWLYIDGVLVLDMGGTHAASDGSINFATGEITYRSYNPENNFGLEKDGTGGTGYDDVLEKYTIKECFKEAGVYSEDAFEGNTFADYTRHRIDYFYMERGSASSCCHIKFNIPTIPTAKVGITKNLESIYDESLKTHDYKMKLYVETETGSGQYEPYKGAYVLQTNGSDATQFTTADGTFTVKHGQTAMFDVPLGRTYFVEEYEVNGYKVSYKYDNNDSEDATVEDGTATSDIYEITETGNNIIVNNTTQFTNISGLKTWDDNENQDGKRPMEIEVILLANGNEVARKIVTSSNNWQYVFENMPIYDANGKQIIYTVSETAVDGYTANPDGWNLTNMHTPEKISVKGQKTWDDNENQDGVRPESITISLLANGQKVAGKTVTVTAADNWSWIFKDLPKYEAGKEIIYTVEEETVNEYETTVDGMNVKNTHKPETTSVSGSKVWDDKDDQDGKRPEKIVVNLYADGVWVKSKEVTATDDWKWTFDNIAKYKDGGKEVIYTFDEEEVAGYYTEIEGNIITNKYNPEKTSVIGRKTWDDDGDRDGVRPESITINLYADGEKIASKVVTEADNWSWEFSGLDKYRNHGTEIAYTIEEEVVEGYTTTVDGKNVTNTHKPEQVTVSGNKTWDDADNQDGIRPEKIKINLHADGVYVTSKEVTADDNWSWEFSGLNKYRDQGQEIVYTVTEELVEGYEITLDGMNVTNTHTPEVTAINGSKIWDDADNQDGIRPEKVTINLFADGEAIESVEVSEDTNWEYSFENLPVYRDQGVKIEYTITEDAVEGYETTIDGYDVTNTHVPEVISVSGSKTWDDADDKDGIRPASITINLLANGEVVDSRKVTEADDWTWTFDDIPKYKAGEEIEYTITEDAVEGYETTIDGYDVTNTHEPVAITKTGDNSNMVMYLITMGIAAAAIISLVAYRRRR